MKKNIAKIISVVVLATSIVVPTSVMFAEETAVINNENETTEISVDTNNAVIVDNSVITDAEVIVSNDVAMFPARKVFEALGYDVEWNNDTKTVTVSNLPQYVTFKIGVDGYTFAKTAPFRIGTAPELVDGVTYVPVTLLSEIFKMDVTVDRNENILISIIVDDVEDTTEETTEGVSEESTEVVSEEGVSEESSENGENTEETTDTAVADVKVVSNKDNEIVVNDENLGEVVLVLGDDCEIVFNDNSTGVIDDIKAGAEITVEYGDAMTASLPPVNNPVKIVINK